jgi:bifunctional non-homologous end joining protein LigD
MPMDHLSVYRAKRDFRATPEPRGGRAKRKAQLGFVIQKHDATRLHYDFRLELGGTLKSWAVPKGPSLDPAEKRLAVHVEDHPLEYATFEGVIPEGHYGAGEVIVWDRGTWIPDGDPEKAYRAGKLKFELNGEKLHGHWTLVRTRLRGSGDKEQWLLIKERDEEARPHEEYDVVDALPESVIDGHRLKRDGTGEGASRGKAKSARKTNGKSAEKPAAAKAAKRSSKNQAESNEAPTKLEGAIKAALPAALLPQLATLVDMPPSEGEWRYEVKFDGYRILARVKNHKVQFFSRRGHDWTAKLPSQRAALEAMKLDDAWLDGEVVVLAEGNVPNFQKLQNAFDHHETDDIRYFLFDVPFYGGYDLRQVPLVQRRALLKALLADNASPLIGFSADVEASPADILDSACKLHMEGVIGKRADSTYVSARSRNWIKLKCKRRQEFVIGGFTEPRGTRTGFGALLLGVYADGKLRYAGRVGTGFDVERLETMHKQFKELEIKTPAFADPPTGAEARGVHWVKPKLVAEVEFAEWTSGHAIRQGVFQGLRADKPATEIVRETFAVVEGGERGGVAKAKRPAGKAAKNEMARTGIGAKPGGKPLIHGIAISHPDRVIDKSQGFTKLEVAEYYDKIASAILPHLKSRPVALIRVPENIEGEQFFQKHIDKLVIPHVRQLPPDLDPGHEPLIALESAQALVGAAQMGTVELHTWNAVAASIERPDRVIFDLDPDPSLPWARVVEAAEILHELLSHLELKGFLKTSGGRGLHIVVPLLRRHTWEAAKRFSRLVALHLAATLPDRFSAKMGARNRIGKVFVDYLRNNRGSSTVSAFSLRARPGLPVSVPISWEELVELKSSAQWNIKSVHDRLREVRDPWAGYEASRQSIVGATKKLSGVVQGE